MAYFSILRAKFRKCRNIELVRAFLHQYPNPQLSLNYSKLRFLSSAVLEKAASYGKPRGQLRVGAFASAFLTLTTYCKFLLFKFPNPERLSMFIFSWLFRFHCPKSTPETVDRYSSAGNITPMPLHSLVWQLGTVSE